MSIIKGQQFPLSRAIWTDKETSMSGILCAIRGGPSSQPTIAASIRLAKETSEIIYFLYVVNLDFLTHTSSSKTNHISKEIEEMGEFILLGAQEQAHSQGVEAESIIRDGKVMDEIITYCEERRPTYVILGRPQEDQEDNLLTLERLHTFAERLEETC
ncbi:MAG TPA: universal stress protein, partial [Chloroflexi bacterium]|nr:universal stress protein [Chloroflexota bacterium]